MEEKHSLSRKEAQKEAQRIEAELARVRREKEKLEHELPHLYGYKWYEWAYSFYTSRNRMNLLCAANQISKSSTQIRKAIEWAGNFDLWDELWPGKTCRMMWYLYPTKEVFSIEWETKWVEFMPRGAHGEGSNHPKYGWKKIKEKSEFVGVEFNSGMRLYFRTYAQNVSHLQSGTVGAIFCFPKDTLITTTTGLKPIQDIIVDNFVLTQSGTWQPVNETHSREDDLYRLKLSNGQTIDATEEHPFYTQRGWVPLGQLTSKDVCYIVPGWNLIKKLYCLRASFTSATRSIRMFVAGITPEVVSRSISTLRFGSPITRGKSQKVTSYTTKTSMLKTTGSRILNSSLVQNIRGFIRKKSGRLKESGSLYALSAASLSLLGLLRKRFLDIAHRNVVDLRFILSASVAAFHRRLAKTLRPVSVVEVVPTGQKATVYNISVNHDPTYFADGILVHNCDEELPEELYPELIMRISGMNGYFHMVFTATLNQPFWQEALEGEGDKERFPDAWKRQVSKYECLEYMDGTPGAYTNERIEEEKQMCGSDVEIARRIMGKFVTEEGRKYPQFHPIKNMIKPFSYPLTWLKYSGVDIGSGGKGNKKKGGGHPPAFVFVAMRDDGRFGVAYKGWRGDDGEYYTAGDIYEKYLEYRGSDVLVEQRYDQGARDFKTITDRAGDNFMAANKRHEDGEDTLNLLFKSQMLQIFDTEDLRKLKAELAALLKSTPKKHAKDDFSDALRYCTVTMPWDWSMLKKKRSSTELKFEKDRPLTDQERIMMEIETRRGHFFDPIEERKRKLQIPGWDEWEGEIDEWNEAYIL